MALNWREHIAGTPNVLHGKPRTKETRIPVSLILGYLAAGNTAEEIIGEFPDLAKEQIAACLDYARDLVEISCESLAMQKETQGARNECLFLDRIRRRITGPGKSPSEVILEKWDQEWKQDPRRLLDYLSIH